MITEIFYIGAADGHGHDNDQSPEYDISRTPQPELQIIPLEHPEENERRERDNAVIRKGILDDLENGRDPARRRMPPTTPTVWHSPVEDDKPTYLM